MRLCTVPGCERRRTGRGLCATHYRNVRLYGRLDGAPDPICETCELAFERPGKSGPLPRYCSRACDPRTPVRMANCRFCGDSFDRAGARREFCSSVCANRSRANHRDASFLGRRCYICGSEIDFTSVGPGGRRARSNVRRCNQCRRQTNYPTTVADLVARDGSNCALCGQEVDLTLSWPNPMCATRDHIVPASRGGSDEATNLQLAHSRCNRSRGASMLVTA